MPNPLQQGLTRYFSADQLEKIAAARVLVCGCGGLGSNLAHMLVRSGFRRLCLLDFDRIEPSNLNRQFYFPDQIGLPKVRALADNLLRLQPELEIALLQRRLERADVAELCKDWDIIVEAFDNPVSKQALVSEAVQTGKPVVAVSGIAGYGNADAIVTRRLGRNLYLIGDGQSDAAQLPPLAPRVWTAAAKQADVVLTLVLDARG